MITLETIRHCITARELGSTSLMFLCHPTLTGFEIEKTCDVLRAVMEEAGSQ